MDLDRQVLRVTKGGALPLQGTEADVEHNHGQESPKDIKQTHATSTDLQAVHAALRMEHDPESKNYGGSYAFQFNSG